MKRWSELNEIPDLREQLAELRSIKKANFQLLDELESLELLNAEEWFTLGKLYDHSCGVEKDVDMAKHCFLEAAALGYSDSMAKLGSIALMHQTPQSYAESVNWNKQAADLGHPHAMVSLGFAYRDGFSVDQDYEMAASWFKKSINHGGHCYHLLGSLYSRHMKMPDEGLKWYLEGEKQGQFSFIEIANLYAIRNSPTYDPIKAENYYLKRVEQCKDSTWNKSSGMLELARLYLSGEICDGGLPKAQTLLKTIIEQEDPKQSKHKEAQKLLSRIDGMLF